MKRRLFIKQAIGAAAIASARPAFSADRILGANERVRVGLIGCGSRGKEVAKLMAEAPNTEFTAFCDVYETNASAAKNSMTVAGVLSKDFRRVLDQKEIDAVLIATPDHWHAPIAVLACQAGKDVYVEKPLAHNVREGRAIVDAARRHNRIVQVGTQHRSAEHYKEAAGIVQSGELGEVHFVRVWNFINLHPRGIGRVADSPAPEGLDWDFYLGPAPMVPFNKNRFLGTYRWFWDYAGGMITDFGTHRFDSVHQVMGAAAPLSVSAAGQRFSLMDGGETPDFLQATFEYPGFVLSYEASMINSHGTGGRTSGKKYYQARGQDDRPHGEAFYGTNGTLFTDRLGFEIYPELKPGSAGPDGSRMVRRDMAATDATGLHARNFIDCIRSRSKPPADAEAGQRATTAGHLGNIAYKTGRKLKWDAAKEQILGDAEASNLLGRAPRKPWDLIKL
jgi:predicted dehydrogenase